MYIYVLIILGLISCVSKTKYDKAIITIDSLKVENQKLLVENEELLHGEERLINYINMHYKDGKYINAEEKLIQLKSKHPESKFLTNNQELFTIIHKNARHQKDSIEKHIKDSIRLANINELGDWEIGDYVDEFGNKTGEHFIYREIKGHFSNSATSWSDLSIFLQISKSTYYYSGYNCEFGFDEYSDGVKEEYMSNYNTKLIKYENNKRIMIGDCKYIDGGWGKCDCKYPDGGEKDDIYLIELLKDEGKYSFEVTVERRSYSADTKYYFTIDSKYINNALLKAGIDNL